VISHYLREAPDPAPLCEATVFTILAEQLLAVCFQTAIHDTRGAGSGGEPGVRRREKTSLFKLKAKQVRGETMKTPCVSPP
jgi:hypothetical protein